VGSDPIVVLGTGMAGLGAATVLRDAGAPFLVLDRASRYGGHTITHRHPAGFLFDDGPHVSFTKDERIRRILHETVGGREREVAAHIDNHWRGRRITHPVQLNLHALPADLATDILVDFVEILGTEPAGDTYADWLLASYGRTFAETFPMVYGRKYHTTEMERLTTDWLGPRMYRPTLRELVQGALEPPAESHHYVTSFRYPEEGGFESYLAPFGSMPEVRLDAEVAAVDPAERRVRLADGGEVAYSVLVSSLPLTELVPRIAGVPDAVREAAARLSFSSAVMVNVGVDRDDITDTHIRYVYDEDIVFARLNFPHLLSPANVPPGMSSIQAEIYFSDRYRPLTAPVETLVEPTIDGLRRMGVLRPDDRIVAAEARLARYANIIYDHDRAAALAVVEPYLAEIGLVSCGRYGRWNHFWTDESYVSGEEAATAALGALSAR
jgi:protoporphyrinogen oxidase